MNIQTIITLLQRSLREGLKQVWRNKFLSMGMLLLGVVIIFLINVIFSVRYLVDFSINELEQRADFSVVLREDFNSFDFDAMANQLDAFDLSKQLLPAQDIGAIVLPQRLYIQFNDIEDVEPVFAILKNNRYDTVVGEWDLLLEQDFVGIVENLLAVKELVETLAFGLVVLFVFAGVLLVFNTFRITVFTRRNEIGISRVVGAENGFIIGPFVVEGMILGFVATLLSILFYVFVLTKLSFIPGGDVFEYLFDFIFLKEFMIAIGVGAIGAFFAVRRYLNGVFFYD